MLCSAYPSFRVHQESLKKGQSMANIYIHISLDMHISTERLRQILLKHKRRHAKLSEVFEI